MLDNLRAEAMKEITDKVVEECGVKTLKPIFNRIHTAANNGLYQTTTSNLYDYEIEILKKYGYKVSRGESLNEVYYTISWGK